MSTVTTHVLDTALGRPAVGVPVRLESLVPAGGRQRDSGARVVAEATTDVDGRVVELGPDRLEPGGYRLVLDTQRYFAADRRSTFFPEVVVSFTVADPTQHYHVPVLLSPFAYSTYRGS
ncbi:MAG: hydroxyisourate hydrolase [Nocardioidaceae bacterium]